MISFPVQIQIDADKIIGKIDDYLYGANLEHIGESIYGGIWAEMLKSPKFSGPDPHFVSMSHGGNDNPNHGVVVPWQAVNPDYARVICEHDHTHVYVRPRYQTDAAVHKGIHPPAGMRGVWTHQQSQRITIREDDGRPHGIKQGDLHLESGQSYQLRLVLKGEGQDVTVRLGDQEWQLTAVGAAWHTVQETVTPASTHLAGELAITFQGTGSLWLARASLMPANHVSGFRRELIEAIEASWTPTFLRWPGGNFASAYHWQDGIGDRDKRPPYLDPAWQIWDFHDVGTDEFMTYCKLVDSEPILTINMGTGTPAEAAAWVEYCNGAATTPYGSLRAENGHSEPYGVKTWFVGNEQFGNWQDGHCDPETYAHRYLTFARAMRAVDPDLLLLAVGVPTDQYAHWNERVLAIAGAEMDMLSMHWYSLRTMRWDETPAPATLVVPQLAAAYEIDFILQKTVDIIDQHAPPSVALAFDEWNTYIRAKPPGFVEDYNLADALYTGSVMNACIRRCDRIKMSAPFNFVNVMGNYRVTQRAVWPTPSTLVLDLMTRLRGSVGIDCQVTAAPTFSSPAIGQQFAYDAVPVIDAAATYDPEADVIYLSLVNNDVSDTAVVSLDGLTLTDETKLYQVAGKTGIELNTEDAPAAVTIQEVAAPGNAEAVTLPPLSFTMVVLPR